MFKNIAKRIQLFAIILAVVLLVGFLALAAFFLYSMLSTTDETLRSAGLQGIIISVILAVVTPLFSWMVYGFGTLIQCAERQAETSKETRDLLRQALSEGALSEELTRKLGFVITKAMAAAPKAAHAAQQTAPPLAAKPATPPAPKAPSIEPVAPVAPVAPATAVVTEAPAEPVQEKATPKAPTVTTTKPTEPVAPPTNVPSTVQPLKPLGGNNKTY